MVTSGAVDIIRNVGWTSIAIAEALVIGTLGDVVSSSVIIVAVCAGFSIWGDKDLVDAGYVQTCLVVCNAVFNVVADSRFN